MKFSSTLTAKSLVMAGCLIFSIASMGVVQARECDMSDSIDAGDSAAIRDTDCEPKDGEKKQRATSRMSSDSKRDNSRYSTDGIERYQEGNDRDEGYNGTGPRREGRY